METKLTDRRAIIINTARELFWKHGFRRVSVEEISEKAGISKMTFYRYFPNKVELAKTVFRSVVEDGYLQFCSIMNNDLSTPEEKIHKILLMKYEGTHDISKEFMTDFYADKEMGLSDFVQEIIKEIWQRIITDFRVAKEKGIFRHDLNLDFFFVISQRLIELFNDQKISAMFDSPQEMIMETVKLLMYGISPREK
jgi:AcrR family transcriptional regulator